MVELNASEIVQYLMLAIIGLLLEMQRRGMKRSNRVSEDTTVTGNPGENIPGKAQPCIDHITKMASIETKLNSLCTQMNRLLNSRK